MSATLSAEAAKHLLALPRLYEVHLGCLTKGASELLRSIELQQQNIDDAYKTASYYTTGGQNYSLSDLLSAYDKALLIYSATQSKLNQDNVSCNDLRRTLNNLFADRDYYTLFGQPQQVADYQATLSLATSRITAYQNAVTSLQSLVESFKTAFPNCAPKLVHPDKSTAPYFDIITVQNKARGDELSGYQDCISKTADNLNGFTSLDVAMLQLVGHGPSL